MHSKVTILKFENHLSEDMFFIINPAMREHLVGPGGHFQIKITEPEGLHLSDSALVKQRCQGPASMSIDVNPKCSITLVADGVEEKIW